VNHRHIVLTDNVKDDIIIIRIKTLGVTE